MTHHTELIEAGERLHGKARYRHLKRQAAVMALAGLHRQDAADICCAVLDEIAAGMPDFDPWGSTRDDAFYWAEIAHPAELEFYYAAALRALGRRALGRPSSKRLFVELYRSFHDDDRKAFLARVDGDGRFRARGTHEDD